jgi:hypothetical protein
LTLVAGVDLPKKERLMLLHQLLHLEREGSGQTLSIVVMRSKTPAMQMLINEGIAHVPMLAATQICGR